MKYKTKPANSKLDIRRKEDYYKHIRKYKDFKDNNQYRHRFNKKYKHLLIDDLPYQSEWKVKQYMSTDGIYKSLNHLKKNGYFTTEIDNIKKLIPTSEVEEELFRREMCCFRDWRIWIDDNNRNTAKRENYNKKRRTRKFYMTFANRPKLFFGKFDVKRAKHAEKVANHLYKHLYIFDKDSPYYLADKEIRNFVKLYMQTNKFLTEDFKLLILNFKENSKKPK
jgi:hypothetical protein